MPLDPHDVLRRVFSYAEFRGPQREVIDAVIRGQSALLVMPTGSGKSLCYQIPSIVRDGLGVVVSPLIALMHDQVAALRSKGVRAAFLNSAQTPEEMREVRGQMESRELDLLYVAPERLLMPGFLNVLDRLELALFAIDEAHCVSAWGHDFRPDYLQLSTLCDRYPNVPRLALTATADRDTRADIIARLRLEEAAVFIAGFDRPNLHYTVTPKTKDHLQQLLRFINRRHRGQSGIVYRLTRDSTEYTAEWLREHGVSAVPYHAGLDDDVRKAHQDRFLTEPGLVVVATIAFGMGVDKPDVRFVAHLEMPKSLEDYHQQTGRAGRDGLPAEAWMTYGVGDAVMFRRFIEKSEADEAFKTVERKRLRAMEQFCKASRCRRQALLGYFGERPPRSCGNCDVCDAAGGIDTADDAATAARATDADRHDAPEARAAASASQVRMALVCVLETGQAHGADYIGQVLSGRRTPRITAYKHDRVRTFGMGGDLRTQQWETLLTQMVETGHLALGERERGVLTLGEAGLQALLGEAGDSAAEATPTPRPSKPARKRAAEPTVELDERAEKLFERLRAWRGKVADELHAPAYCVFWDATLRAIASAQPTSQAELVAVHNLGAAKAERYGEAVLDIVRAFRQEE